MSINGDWMKATPAINRLTLTKIGYAGVCLNCSSLDCFFAGAWAPGIPNLADMFALFDDCSGEATAP